MVLTPIIEPVDKKIQAQFVQAEQNLMWLAEHGRLSDVAMQLQTMRDDQEFAEKH